MDSVSQSLSCSPVTALNQNVFPAYCIFKYENTLTIFQLSCSQWDKSSFATETLQRSLLERSCNTQIDGSQMLSEMKSSLYLLLFCEVGVFWRHYSS